MQRGIWSVYADVHPWMVADPEDPSIAYCSICQKRFMYGNSEIKRKNHENSEKHTSAVAAQAAHEIPFDEANDEAIPTRDLHGEGELEVPALLGGPSESDGSEEDYNNVTDDNWSETQRAKKS